MLLRLSIGAFLSNADTTAAMESLREDRLLFRCTFEIEQGGIDAAVKYLGDKPTPELLVVETAAQGDQLFQQLESLANVCDPNAKVMLIGAQNDIGLFRTLIQEGISDYLVTPVTAEQFKESVEKIFAGRAEDEFDGRIIAFAGMTGGVGSSVISHNVAHELCAAYDEQVIVVDLDIPYGTAALDFNMQPRQTVVDVLSQAARIDPQLVGGYLMEYGETKVSILTSPASLTTGYHITPEPLDKLLNTVRPMAGFIVLDLPHLWDGWINDALAAADEVVLVCRPDLTNLRNAKNVIEFLGPKRGTDAPTRLVLNQVGAAKRADLSDKDFKDTLALAPALSIPYDPEAFGKALNTGEMMSKSSAKSKATEGIGELAKLVSGREKTEEGEKKGLGLFKRGKKKEKDKD